MFMSGFFGVASQGVRVVMTEFYWTDLIGYAWIAMLLLITANDYRTGLLSVPRLIVRKGKDCTPYC